MVLGVFVRILRPKAQRVKIKLLTMTIPAAVLVDPTSSKPMRLERLLPNVPRLSKWPKTVHTSEITRDKTKRRIKLRVKREAIAGGMIIIATTKMLPTASKATTQVRALRHMRR